MDNSAEGGVPGLLAIQEDPGFPSPYRYLAFVLRPYGSARRGAIVARLRVITPVVIPDASPFRNPEHYELYLSGLRLAAGEAA